MVLIFIHDILKSDAEPDKPKVAKMAKESIGNSGRKTLADISNMPRRPSSLTQDNKPRPSSATVKEYIEQLQKENAALVKLLADRKYSSFLLALVVFKFTCRIIELSGAELHKLRITLQKMQQQNLQLAQSHSQMLADYNSGKDRLKELQHQLGCKNSLLTAKQLELEGKRKLKTRETTDNKKVSKLSDREEPGICTVAEGAKGCQTNRRQKSKSLGPCVAKGQDEGVADNGRLKTRRQSARFKQDEPRPDEDVFHTENVDLPPCRLPDEIMQEDDSNSVAFTAKKEDVEADTSGKMGKRKPKTCDTNGIKKVKVSRHEDTEVYIAAESDEGPQCNANGKQKSKSLGPSVSKGQERSVAGNGRLLGRRRSARSKHNEPTSTEDVFDTDNVDLPPCLLADDKMQEDDSNSVAPSLTKEEVVDSTLPDKATKECKRSSISRPSRAAASKVQSYKEMGLQVKMRRPEVVFEGEGSFIVKCWMQSVGKHLYSAYEVGIADCRLYVETISFFECCFHLVMILMINLNLGMRLRKLPAVEGEKGGAEPELKPLKAHALLLILSYVTWESAIKEIAKSIEFVQGLEVLCFKHSMTEMLMLDKFSLSNFNGAYNTMAKLSKEKLDQWVICSSAGNHGQGVALSAKTLGCDVVIVMPVTTPRIKWESVKRLGATVVLKGDSYKEAQAYAKKRGVVENRTFIPPFDHPDVISGQGTVRMEIVRQLKGPIHAIFVPIGGDSLIDGIAAYVRESYHMYLP
ncbi:shugoshin [Tanacetum coccineum]